MPPATSIVADKVLAYDHVLELVAHLRTHENVIVSQWGVNFSQSRLRFATPAEPGRYQTLVAGLVEATALAAYGGFTKGGPDSREVERVAAFVGATLAADTATTFDVGAMMTSVHEAIAQQVLGPSQIALGDLFGWLTLIACDAFASARLLALTEQQADELVSGTPIFLVAPRVPVLAMVASPSQQTVHQVMSRALMVALAASAPTLIINVDGLSAQGIASMAGALQAIDQHNITTLTYMVVGDSKLAKQLFGEWRTHLGDRVSHTNEIFVGIRDCLGRLGYNFQPVT